MTDPRAADGVEHLQRAAREMLKAARSFLDVVEDVVEDPERLTSVAGGFADLVRNGLGRQDPPWSRAAWSDDLDTDTSESSPTSNGAAHTDAVADAADADEADRLFGPDDPDEDQADGEPSGIVGVASSDGEVLDLPGAAPAAPAARRARPASRVRRIAVE